jgi:hypothetical protein
MEVLDTITLKDIKFDHQVASMSHGGRMEKIVAAELGAFTMFYIYSKVGKVKSRQYLLRRGKTNVTDELEWDQMLAELKRKSYTWNRDEKGKLFLEHTKRGILRKILS